MNSERILRKISQTEEVRLPVREWAKVSAAPTATNMHLSFRSRPFISSAPDFVYESGWNRLSLAKLGLTVESDSQSCFAIWFFSPFPCFLLPSILHEALTNEWRGRGLKLMLQPRSHIGVHPRFHQWEHNCGIIDAELNADVRSSVTRIFKNNLIWKMFLPQRRNII